MTRRATVIVVFIIAFSLYARNVFAQHCYGLFMGEDVNAGTIARVANDYGRMPCVISVYWDWNSAFDERVLDEIWSAGAVPMITLEPWDANSKKGIPLNEIAEGRHDGVLSRLSGSLGSFGHPVLIRFAHEMNGNWYPWSGEKNGKSSGAYIDAYRHVHDALRSSYPASVWVWSVNAEDVPKKKWNRIDSYYPGDGYVDAIGIDGYNWPKFWPWKRCETIGNIYDWVANRLWGRLYDFDRIFSEQLDIIGERFPGKPVFITEVATGLKGPVRQNWVVDFFAKLRQKYPGIALFVWFDVQKEADWRIGADDGALACFRDEISEGGWDADREDLLRRVSR